MRVTHLGVREYLEVLEIQRDLVDRRARNEVPDTLILVEHPGVITLGRGSCAAASAVEGSPVHQVARGGAATYHGPGQVVAYPIVHLKEGERDLHRYLRNLEEAGIQTCNALGLAAVRRAGHTGVWVGERKVASVGVAVRRWVTYHGIALNGETDLRPFRRFRPCGLDGRVMTSLLECGVPRADLVRVPSLLAGEIAAALGVALEAKAISRTDS